MLRTWLALIPLCLAGPALAGSECADWVRLDDAEKSARIDAIIEGHLQSNVGKRYTSENTVAMRRCLRGHAPEIRAEFDGTCDQGRLVAMDALDEIFDRYFLSCVQ
jgi:hypothetical protein